ncbi:hypothetical protein C8R44DRAFT_749934 [Mycena epipterygia]|nr:hypothetical protein C8R44DRAFT_749934 [Mycena epipterygia]
MHRLGPKTLSKQIPTAPFEVEFQSGIVQSSFIAYTNESSRREAGLKTQNLKIIQKLGGCLASDPFIGPAHRGAVSHLPSVLGKDGAGAATTAGGTAREGTGTGGKEGWRSASVTAKGTIRGRARREEGGDAAGDTLAPTAASTIAPPHLNHGARERKD